MADLIWQGSPLGFLPSGEPLAYEGNAATLIFGPPGSSKTVGILVNQLLDEMGRRSFVVIDPKGELTAITANWRRRVCGAANVRIINPYGVLTAQRGDLASEGWNPLGDLDPDSRRFGDDCAAKGDALIKTDANEHQKHFPDSARSGVTGAIMYEVIDARAQGMPPSLAAVRAVLSQEPTALKASIRKMMALGHFDINARLAKFLAATDEIAGIKSTIETQTAWMTMTMRDDMATAAGVDFRACRQRPTTIYVILPTEELQAKAVYLRLVLSSALRALYKDGGVPTTLLVEEGFVLGHHAEIEQALSILRAFGSRMTVVFQSLQQIKRLYADTWGLFMSGAVLGFRPGDLETAEWMSKRAGDITRPVLSAADPANPMEVGARPSWQPQRRELISVGKMFDMPQGTAVAWVPGQGTRVVDVKGYFEIPKIAARADPNPYHASSARKGKRSVAAVAGVALLAAAGWFAWPRVLPLHLRPAVVPAARAAPLATPAPVRRSSAKRHAH